MVTDVATTPPMPHRLQELRLEPDEAYDGLAFVVHTLQNWASTNRVNFSPRQIMSHLDQVSQSKIVPSEMNGYSLEKLLPGINAARAIIEDYCGHDINETEWIMTGWLIDRLLMSMGVGYTRIKSEGEAHA